MSNLCSHLFVAAALVVASAGPGRAQYTAPDYASRDASDLCAQSFDPKNSDVRMVSAARAAQLTSACLLGVERAHAALYDPYRVNVTERYPVRLPSANEFRFAYGQGLAECRFAFRRDGQLRERLACFDGYDNLAGTLVAQGSTDEYADVTPPRFDRAYFQTHTFENVYQDVPDARAWAWVLRDRVTDAANYPAYRRDQLYVPSVPEDQADQVDVANGIPDGRSRGLDSSGAWYLFENHYRRCTSCKAYVPRVTYQDPLRPRSLGGLPELTAFGPRAMKDALAAKLNAAPAAVATPSPAATPALVTPPSPAPAPAPAPMTSPPAVPASPSSATVSGADTRTPASP